MKLKKEIDTLGISFDLLMLSPVEKFLYTLQAIPQRKF